MSYSTILEANIVNINNETWNALDDTTKQSYLDYATQKINSLNYSEKNLVDGQTDVFPWSNQTFVPFQVKEACSYEAGQLAIGTVDEAMDLINSKVKSESELSASISYDTNSIDNYMYANKYFLSSEAWKRIFPYLDKSASWGYDV